MCKVQYGCTLQGLETLTDARTPQSVNFALNPVQEDIILQEPAPSAGLHLFQHACLLCCEGHRADPGKNTLCFVITKLVVDALDLLIDGVKLEVRQLL